MLGVDPALDGVAFDLDLGLPHGERIARGDADLLVHEIDAGDHFRHRVLDLDAGVHLDEEELPVLVQELDRARSLVAELLHGAGDHSADALALRFVEGRRGAFLPDLLVPPLQGAVALAEMDGPAPAVAEHLDLDVAGLFEVLLEVDGVVAERRLGFRARRRERAVELVAGPRHLHAAPAAARRGLDQHGIADLVGDALRLVLVRRFRASEPGTHGMPRRLAVRFASILSPMIRMCSGFGPMKAMP